MTEITSKYYKVWDWTIEQLKFKNPAEMIVFNFVYGLNQNDKFYRGSAKYLANHACASISTIRRAVKSLAQRGLISVEYGKCPAGKCWHLNALINEDDFAGLSKDLALSFDNDFLY